jgi:hypothetical protein
MKKINYKCITPSSAFSVPRSKIKQYDDAISKRPGVGDLIFGEVCEIGHHKRVESRSARLDTINSGTRSIFVFGNRYAPDQFEDLVPDAISGLCSSSPLAIQKLQSFSNLTVLESMEKDAGTIFQIIK